MPLTRLRAIAASRVAHLLIAVCLALAALSPSSASAQRSGGRFGSSSSFRSSSSSSSSSSYGGSSSRSSYGGSSGSSSRGSSSWSWPSSSRSSSSRSSSSSSSSYSSTVDPESDSAPDNGRFARNALYLLLVVAGIAVIYAIATRSRTGGGFVDGEKISLRRISIGLDWSVREQLQRALDQLAAADAQSEAGRYRSLVAVRDILRANLQGARYAAVVGLELAPEQAEARFQEWAADVNRRYDVATISDQRRNEAPDVTARREEGQGFVVVSVIVASSSTLLPLPAWPARESVDGALVAMVPSMPHSLVALEVVWSPSIDQDRLSSAELEVLYPELMPFGSTPPGRVQCKYCKCVSAAELGECPSCGSRERSPVAARNATPPPTQVAPPVVNVSSADVIPCPRCRRPMPRYEVQCMHCGTRREA